MAPGRARWVECSWLGAFLLLAAMSVLGFNVLQPGHAKLGWLHYYGGVGQASTVAIFGLPLFVLWTARRESRLVGVLGLLAALVIGFATLNRIFYVSAAFVLAIGYWPLLKRHWARAWGAAAVLCVCAAFMILHSSSERASAARCTAASDVSVETPLEGRLQGILSNDTRPMIWRFYLDKAKERPILGIGFGKRLPKKAYCAQVPEWLNIAEPQASTHAHNLFLNTFLQLGVVGLILQCGLFAMMFRAIYASAGNPWIVSACAALLVGMITKNLTDDLMWQSAMLAFWGQFGWLLGRAQKVVPQTF